MEQVLKIKNQNDAIIAKATTQLEEIKKIQDEMLQPKKIQWFCSIIYKIVSKQTDFVFYGLTTQEARQQCFIQHKINYKKYLKGEYPHDKSFEVLKFNDCKVYTVMFHSFSSEKMLREAEQKNLKRYQCNLVAVRVSDTETEPYLYDKVKSAAYYQANRDRLREKHECPCGGIYTTSGKSGHVRTNLHQQYIAAQ